MVSSLVFFSCSKSETTDSSEGFVSKFITAAEGGMIETENGISLTIPAGALDSDMEIKLKSLQGEAFDEFGIIGAVLEPNGLEFVSELTLRFPLPNDWDDNEMPAVYYSSGDNASDFFLTLKPSLVMGGPGSYYAEVGISHFSAWGLARNCHAGTMKHLFDDFRNAGCNLDEMTLEVREKWDNKFRVDPYDYNGDPEEFSLGNVPLQCFFDVYFYEHGSFTLGEDITEAYLQSLRNLMINRGKRVAIGFNDVWRDDDGDGIFEGFAHSAALEIVNNELKLRQSVSVNEKVIGRVVDALGDNIVYYPTEGELTADLLNAYRLERSGVLLEEAICGSVNCLFSAPLHLRAKPYTSILFYVSNYASGENPCEPVQSEFTSCFFNMTVSEIMVTTIHFDTGQTTGGQVNGTTFVGTYTGTMNGNIFTGFRDDAPANTTLNSTISIELDDHREKVMLMHVYYHFEGAFTSERELIVANIPIDDAPGFFEINGIEACDHIELFTTKTTYSDRETTMDSYSCYYGDEIIEIYLY